MILQLQSSSTAALSSSGISRNYRRISGSFPPLRVKLLPLRQTLVVDLSRIRIKLLPLRQTLVSLGTVGDSVTDVLFPPPFTFHARQHLSTWSSVEIHCACLQAANRDLRM
eukprot:37934-Rhodomonas_salina.4